MREALVRAASQNLLTRESNKGFRVAPLLTQDDYKRLIDVRRMLELHAVATADLSPDDVGRLADALNSMRAAASGSGYADVIGFTRADNDFHLVLIEACKNHFVVDAWRNLHHTLHVYRIYFDGGVFDSSEAISEHADILVAARAGDRDRLAGALKRHIDAAAQRHTSSFPATGNSLPAEPQ